MWYEGRPPARGEGGPALAIPSADARRPSLALLGLLTLAGALLRLLALRWGLTPDEIGWVLPGGVAANWSAGETAVNPPLIRMLVAAISPSVAWMPFVGRAISVVAGTAAIPVMFLLGRQVGRGRTGAGLAAAAMVAFLPLAVVHSALYRSYAVLFLVLLWHLVALVRAVEEPEDVGWTGPLAVSAFLLPQLHYATVPVLCFEGLLLAAWMRRTRWLVAYLPAALGFAPLAVRIVQGRAKHLAPSRGPVGTVLDLVKGGGEHVPILLVLTLVVFALWSRWDRRQQALVVALGACVMGLFAVSVVHEARPDLAVVPAAYQLALVASLPLLLAPGWTWRGWVAVVLLVQVSTIEPLRKRVLPPHPQDGPPRVAAELEAGSWPTDAPTWVYPGQHVHAVYFYLAGDRLFTTCPFDPDRICFDTERTRVVAFDRSLSGPSWLVCFEPCVEQATGCAPAAADDPAYALWDCRDR